MDNNNMWWKNEGTIGQGRLKTEIKYGSHRITFLNLNV